MPLRCRLDTNGAGEAFVVNDRVTPTKVLVHLGSGVEGCEVESGTARDLNRVRLVVGRNVFESSIILVVQGFWPGIFHL